jgi:hypothetical protein
MGGPGLADRGNDAFFPVQQLAHKLEADAATGADNKPCSEVLIGVQDIGDLVHGTVLWRDRRLQKDDERIKVSGAKYLTRSLKMQPGPWPLREQQYREGGTGYLRGHEVAYGAVALEDLGAVENCCSPRGDGKAGLRGECDRSRLPEAEPGVSSTMAPFG